MICNFPMIFCKFSLYKNIQNHLLTDYEIEIKNF